MATDLQLTANAITFWPMALAAPPLPVFVRGRMMPRHSLPGIFILISAWAMFSFVGLRAEESHNWTLRDSGTKQTLNAVTGNGTLFVAVGRAGTVLTSPDAINWTPQVSPTELDLNGVAWFHGLFVAVGDNGLILTSPDGMRWIVQNSLTPANLRSVTASATTLVAVGDQGAIRLSSNGSFWIMPSASRLPDLRHIVSTPLGFVIATSHGLVTSADEQHWTVNDSIAARGVHPPSMQPGWHNANMRGAVGIGAVSLNSIAHNEDVSVAVGDAGQIWTSLKAGPWSVLANPVDANFAEKLNDVCWTKRHFVVVGGNGTILSSIDGRNWEKETTPTNENLMAVSGRLGFLVAVGANGTIVTSEDLPVITQPTITPAGGVFTSRPLVTLGCPTPDVTLHYTFDGTEPSETSNTYEEPFWMPKPGELRVRAFKDGMGPSLDAVAEFDMPEVATITVQPVSVRVPCPPLKSPLATFQITASGGIPKPTYQWQWKIAGSDNWDNVPKSNLAFRPKQNVLEVEYDQTFSGDDFRCVVSNKEGEVVSSTAELTVFPPIPASIVKQPMDANVNANQAAKFSVETKGDPEPTYQWARFNKTALKWENLKESDIYVGTKTNLLEVKSSTMEMTGDLFHCSVKNGYPLGSDPLYTNPVSLLVWQPPPLIVKQPDSVAAPPGSVVTFRVLARLDASPTYQWECKLPGSDKHWQPLKDDLLYTGVNTGSLTLHDMSLAMSGYKYRCILDDGQGGPPEVSDDVVLTVQK